MSEKDLTEALRDRECQIRESYRRIFFLDESKDGQVVLDDLMARFHMVSRMDEQELEKCEGQRSVVLYVMEMSEMDKIDSIRTSIKRSMDDIEDIL